MTVETEAEIKPVSEEQQGDVHPYQGDKSGGGRHEYGGAQSARERTDRPSRDEDKWQKSRGERHPAANEWGHPPTNEREHSPANERGRRGPRRGGDPDRRHGPPPTERQERGGARDRERGGGREGFGSRERKTSNHHDIIDGDSKGGRGGGGRKQHQPPPPREAMPENRVPPRSTRGRPLLPNPPGPPALLPSGDVIHQFPLREHEPKGNRQTQPPQHQSKKPSHDREVKGHPDHGYSEVFEIESGEDWENEVDEAKTALLTTASGGVGKGRKETHSEGERGGARRGGESQRGRQPPQSRGNRDEPRSHPSQRGREERGGERREERRHRGEDGEGGRRDGRRLKGERGGRGGDEIPPRHAGQRKSQLQAERKGEENESKLNQNLRS